MSLHDQAFTTELAETTAAATLRRHGVTGQQLQSLAVTISRAYQHNHGATPVHNEDHVQFLLLAALRRAGRYNPQDHPNTTLVDYLTFAMRFACTDYYRSKANGFRDHRKTRNDKVTSITPTDQLDHHLDDLDFTDVHHEQDRVERWRRAADHAGLSLEQWIGEALDVCAGTIAA